MIQTISINLGGLLFHIDDEAYKILQSYLRSVEKQFVDETEKNEIISDIEARLAELFEVRIDRKRDLISAPDVKAVMAIMGKPHDFVDNEEPEPTKRKRSYRSKRTSKRMYRDVDDRVIGGVCSGIGAYFKIDPWIFRAIFIVFTFFFLSGFIIYLILWITIPEALTTAQKLEMRGKPINVENIKNTVKEEFQNVKRRMNL